MATLAPPSHRFPALLQPLGASERPSAPAPVREARRAKLARPPVALAVALHLVVASALAALATAPAAMVAIAALRDAMMP